MGANDHPKVVTLIWNYLNWGGAQIYFLSIARNAPAGWKVKLVLPQDASPDIVEFFRPFVVDVSYLRSSFAPEPASGLWAKVRQQFQRVRSEIEMYGHLRKNAPAGSVVHIEAPAWQSWILLSMLSFRYRTVSTVHNTLWIAAPAWRNAIWWLRFNFLMRFKRFQIFAANEDARNSLLKHVQPRYWDRISVTRAGINPFEIDEVLRMPADRTTLLEKHGVPTDKFILLCVGQFIDRKGRWIFLEAARAADAANNDLFFVWVGPQPLSESEQKRVDSFDAGSSFKYLLSSTLGSNRLDVLRFFRVADTFVLPSYIEGLPISIIEAMSLGLPVISTNIHAIPEAIEDMSTGILIEPGDAGALTEAIHKLRSDASLRNSISAAGRALAMEKFDERIATAVAYERYEATEG